MKLLLLTILFVKLLGSLAREGRDELEPRLAGWRGYLLVGVVPGAVLDTSMCTFNLTILRHFALSVHHLAPLLLLACVKALEVDTARCALELA